MKENMTPDKLQDAAAERTEGSQQRVVSWLRSDWPMLILLGNISLNAFAFHDRFTAVMGWICAFCYYMAMRESQKSRKPANVGAEPPATKKHE